MVVKIVVGLGLFIVASVGFTVDLELTQGINSALPIAVNSFGDAPEAREFHEIINHDLGLSGQFNVLGTENRNRALDNWRRMGADSILVGHFNGLTGDRYSFRYELVDASSQKTVLLKNEYNVNKSQLRTLAHRVSDDVYQKLLGERGVFSTKIAYILVQRDKNKVRYSLEIADADGFNPHSLLISPTSLMSPSWSPDGQKIAYVSFEKKKAQIFTVDVRTGKRRLITSFNGINGAPSFSPDGSQLAVVLSKGGNPKIYTVNLNDGSLKQVTFGTAIDTEPRYTPDGKSIIFTSGRGGAPQIYKISLRNNLITRLTYEGSYNARAMLTPDQKNMVMMHRDESKRFSIAVQDSNGAVLKVTHGDSDESPSLAPNGRLIIYATHKDDRGILGMVSIDGRMQTRIPVRDGDIQEPSWSPYLG